MNKLDLTALLERVRNATGLDRGLDAAMAIGVGYITEYSEPNGQHGSLRGYEGGVDGKRVSYFAPWWPGDRKWPPSEATVAVNHDIPKFTASIDAALALVERVLPGWAVTVATYHTDYGSPYADMASRRYIENDEGFEHEYAESAGLTPVLAILTALLLALTSNTEGNDEA